MTNNWSWKIDYWRNGTPPPKDEPGKFNQIFELNFDVNHNGKVKRVTVSGLISWDSSVGKYCFKSMKKNEDGVYETYIKTLSAVEYLRVKNKIIQELGVTEFKGFQDEDEDLCIVPEDRTVLH